MLATLGDIAGRYPTDKGSTHNYLGHYEQHLHHLRDEQFVLLEIGIGGYADADRGGGSLRMWSDYFPRAEIVGLDLNTKAVHGDRIHVYRGSQDDRSVLRRIVDEVGPPRVVIDDGSHLPHHVRASFAFLFPELEEPGTYIIEDLQTSYWPEWSGRRSRHAPLTSMALVKSLVDGLNYEEIIGRSPSYTDEHVTGVHCYHNMVFVEKGPNREGSNRERANARRFGPGPVPPAIRAQRFLRWGRQTLRDAETALKERTRRPW